MLVFSRKWNEMVVIRPPNCQPIIVQVTDFIIVDGKLRVKLGFQSDESVRIDRFEVDCARRANANSTSAPGEVVTSDPPEPVQGN